MERTGERVWHVQSRAGPRGEPLLDFRLEAQYVIGSGARGRSYLTERDGFLFQTAISWYAGKGIWDLSPGFDAEMLPGRPVGGDCLFCHVNRAALVPGYRNRFAQPFAAGHAIGCERCHGPGERHIQGGGTLTDGIDPTIVNPKKLTPALREAVCQQCHLEGEGRVVRRGRRREDFRPGLPLESVLNVFVHADDSGDKLVTHVEQMQLSACFRGSAGAKPIGCISCHDPHRKIAAADRVAFYRQRCLQCHDDSDCHAAAPERAARHDSCFDCHMPRAAVADVTHVASTDHRIVRPGKAPPRRSGSGPLVALLPQGAVGDRESRRDRGIAEVEAAPQDRAGLAHGLALLQQATADFPDDVEALQAQGTALLHLEQHAAAADVLHKALAIEPQCEAALARYAEACAGANREADALDAWRRTVERNPWAASYRARLAALLIARSAWQELHPQAAAWLRLDPGNPAAHKAWITALVKTGQAAEARAALNRATALHPFNRGELEAWFAEIQALRRASTVLCKSRKKRCCETRSHGPSPAGRPLLD